MILSARAGILAGKVKAGYVAGLPFECTGCGACCTGPDEDFIWATEPEVTFIAEFLKRSVNQVHQKSWWADEGHPSHSRTRG